VTGLGLRCNFKQGTSPAILDTLAHPAVHEYSCMLTATYPAPTGPQLSVPVPIDCAAVAAKLAALPTTSSLILHPHVTDDQLLSLASVCSHLTYLRANYSSTGCPLTGAVCQSNAVLSGLRKLDLTGAAHPPPRAAAGQPGSSTSRHLMLRLGMLPPQLRSLKLNRAELDTAAPDMAGGAGGAVAAALQEVTLRECVLAGSGIGGLLQLTPTLKLLHMSQVRFGGDVQWDAAKLLAAASLTSLTVNKCEYEDEDALEGPAGLRGYAWIGALSNLRHLEWSHSTWMGQQLLEVCAHFCLTSCQLPPLMRLLPCCWERVCQHVADAAASAAAIAGAAAGNTLSALACRHHQCSVSCGTSAINAVDRSLGPLADLLGLHRLDSTAVGHPEAIHDSGPGPVGVPALCASIVWLPLLP
jgi:hypothetical protein